MVLYHVINTISRDIRYCVVLSMPLKQVHEILHYIIYHAVKVVLMTTV